MARLLVFCSIVLAAGGMSAVAAPATEKDRAYVEYRLYDAMNEAFRDGSASNAKMACEAAKVVVARLDSSEFMDAELAECFGYAAELDKDIAAACTWWEHAAARYRTASRQGRASISQSTFLTQERSRNKC